MLLNYVLIVTAATTYQVFANDVTFLGLLPLYNFFSNNRPAQHPTLSLYESLNPTQVSSTPKISPLVPVYAFLNNFGTPPEPVTPKPTYIIPPPVVTETTEEPITDPPIITTTTARPPIPPPPRPPPPPLPPPITSLIVQDVHSSQKNKTTHPLPVPRPTGDHRPYRPYKRPPQPPPNFRIPQDHEEENNEEEENVVDENTTQEVHQSEPSEPNNRPDTDSHSHRYKYSSKQDGQIYYETLD